MVWKVLRSHLIFHYWYVLHRVIDTSLVSEYFLDRYRDVNNDYVSEKKRLQENLNHRRKMKNFIKFTCSAALYNDDEYREQTIDDQKTLRSTSNTYLKWILQHSYSYSFIMERIIGQRDSHST